MNTYPIAGINVGTVSISLVLLDGQGLIMYKDYRSHNGNIYAALEDMLPRLPVQTLADFGVVAEKGREFFKAGVEVNEQVAIIEGVKHVCPNAGSIISIGGETFGLILFDKQGRYKKYIANSPCAAGTGSFLDQQASRLGLSGSAELSRIAEEYQGDPPRIATRCSVFAKTDLTHIQQQGYGLPAIAAGLSRGVAQNIFETLFQGAELLDPIVVVGGVGKNKKVIKYLEEAVKHPLMALPDGEYMGALGAALAAASRQNNEKKERPLIAVASLFNKSTSSKSFYYPPLSEIQTPIPDFSSLQSWVENDVEIDIYEPLEAGSAIECLVGLDIGSTSTKAALMNLKKEVVVGLYTRTGGQPIAAVQKLTASIENLEKKFSVQFKILAAGTTGSGRKFIQKVTAADYAVDEITAHARAAFHLSPAIDTIIEIGGQDAKFTTMKNGNVAFSVMNYVCAAGTGSFIEEQAKRLGVSLKDYAWLAVDSSSPLISDRCTVFMERDLSHLLSLGYNREELLAAALHSVRDNYLSKVAHINKIGAHIAFQGATAKNHALVKAFEQKLQKPIYVSKFCHLTGAIGVCLKMAETSLSRKSGFRKDLHTEKLTAGEYVCGYCNNNCKIKTIELEGETLGWGYLCGRDEGDSAYRKRKASGFDLLRDHRKVFQAEGRPEQEKARRDVNLFREFQHGGIQSVIRRPDFTLARLRNRIQFNALVLREEIFSAGIVSRNSEGTKTPVLKIGLPSTLNMLEYMPLWELFFKRLGFHVIATSTNKSHIKAGKEISGAEFCAPMAEFQGHIMELDLKADFIFYPQVFENAMDKERKAYCYYTNFAVPIIKNIPARDFSKKLISPVLNFYENLDGVIREIYLKLPEEMKAHTTFNKVEEAFLLAWDWFRERKADLLDLFRDQVGAANDIGVVLMGRPYLILNHSLNKGIPNKLADMGIQSFFMDMVPIEEERLYAALDFIQWNHWHYGNLIIKATEMTAQTPRLFPVYLTAFKCSPDSFIISYFKEIMDYYRKPYLILQMDEHEAGEGYETRLEAAVETFRGFQGAARQDKRPTVNLKKSFEEKTYLLPDYDPLVARLIQAAFQHAGINAMAIEQTPDTFHRSLKINDGQCLPVSALVLGIQHTIQKHGLDPERTAYYSNTDCHISCNLPQYPVMIKQTLERLGCGLEKVDVLVGKFLPSDLPLELMYESSMAYMTAGFVQKIMHKVRPRERIPGSTDSFHKVTSDKLFRCFLEGGSKEDVFQEVVDGFLKIEMKEGPLPQVGLVGDLYVQDNSLFNQNLIAEIEKSGAEAVTIPFFDSILLLAEKLFQYMWTDGRYMDLLRSKVAYNTLKLFNRKLAAIAKPILGNGANGLKGNPLDYLNKYSITIWHGGETPENLLKIFYLHENCPDLKFIINVNPIFCCPGLISEAIYKKLEKEIGIPIVSITYDGAQADKNRALKPYLHFAV